MRHMVQTGGFSSVSFSQAAGLLPLSLAVANRPLIAAARLREISASRTRRHAHYRVGSGARARSKNGNVA